MAATRRRSEATGWWRARILRQSSSIWTSSELTCGLFALDLGGQIEADVAEGLDDFLEGRLDDAGHLEVFFPEPFHVAEERTAEGDPLGIPGAGVVFSKR